MIHDIGDEDLICLISIPNRVSEALLVRIGNVVFNIGWTIIHYRGLHLALDLGMALARV
jgi:hypothetical protein